ncbi:hypothetical protein EJB05_16914 [Eragrostis curvula]|uniref:Tubby C-terminal domain-containing protein n=1 Tax=Eragrostis curvula TaxID=38414 RepID=A0A5J9VHG5_9POAL|nr:hypothetical protein EJB05_16914 [Eragrostis curvula]
MACSDPARVRERGSFPRRIRSRPSPSFNQAPSSSSYLDLPLQAAPARGLNGARTCGATESHKFQSAPSLAILLPSSTLPFRPNLPPMSPWRRASSGSAAAVASTEPARPLSGFKARVSPEISSAEEEAADEGRWSALVPELLNDIIQRVLDGAESWPQRRDVVACACVCRRWREAAVALVRPPLEGGGITFLSSLKQFLLAAHRIRCGLRMEYVISIHSDDLSHGNHVGKLKSDLMRTKFTIYDQRHGEGAKESNSGSSSWIMSKRMSPRVSTSDVKIGEVSYEYNLLKSRGPRKIQCSIQYPAHEAAIDPKEARQLCSPSCVVLINKIPRWHEDLQCWFLNFHGRVMVASVKNFQLIPPMRSGVSWGVEDDETVILQFGKIEKDVFTMDYRQPLSAFQAFAVCLTSFGSKLAFEYLNSATDFSSVQNSSQFTMQNINPTDLQRPGVTTPPFLIRLEEHPSCQLDQKRHRCHRFPAFHEINHAGSFRNLPRKKENVSTKRAGERAYRQRHGPTGAPSEQPADGVGERAVRQPPLGPGDRPGVLHERGAAGEPLANPGAGPLAHEAQELPLLPLRLVEAPQRRVVAQQLAEEPSRIAVLLVPLPVFVIVVGVLVEERAA